MEQSANTISSNKTESSIITMSLSEAIEVMGCDVPKTSIDLCNLYSKKIASMVENKTYPHLKELVGNAYTTMFAKIMSQQIEATGSFDISVDFSGLNDLNLFPKSPKGVDVCRVCSGVGGIIKFNKKPKDVECLKCKDQTFIYFNQKDEKEYNIVISGKTITVDGVDHSNDPEYTKMLGWRVEDCLSCGGDGRIIHAYGMKDLVVNVICKTCGGRKLHSYSEKTQVLTKCKTCQGDRIAKVMVISPEIQHITLCKKCKGNGYIRPFPVLDNPVISKDLASKIRGL